MDDSKWVPRIPSPHNSTTMFPYIVNLHTKQLGTYSSKLGKKKLTAGTTRSLIGIEWLNSPIHSAANPVFLLVFPIQHICSFLMHIFSFEHPYIEHRKCSIRSHSLETNTMPCVLLVFHAFRTLRILVSWMQLWLAPTPTLCAERWGLPQLGVCTEDSHIVSPSTIQRFKKSSATLISSFVS